MREKADVSKGYWNRKGKLGVASHFSETVKLINFFWNQRALSKGCFFCIQLLQLTLSDQSLKLIIKTSSKRLPPHPFDILTFLSSKWLTIVYLHWTDKA